MARVLGRIRLSRNSDESTSEVRQREVIETWARLHGHVIVDWAVDLDVSGSIAPFDAPKLGPWLRDRRSEWDILCSWKLDRLGRGLFDLNDLFRWCREHDKTLVCVADNVDLSTPVGRMVAVLLASVAEMELEAIRTRTKDGADELLRQGRWGGGVVPYGYRAEKREGGWWLVIDDETAAVVRDVFARIIDRQSANSIANHLTASGVKTPRGGKRWSTRSILDMLRGRWVLGQVERDGKLILDEETGLPLQRAEAIVSQSTWQQAQTVLNDSARPRKRSNDTGQLLGILGCGVCGSRMYLRVTTRNDDRVYRYWRCASSTTGKGCGNRSVPADAVEQFVTGGFLRQVGEVERTVRVFVPASGPGELLAEVEHAIATVRKEKDLGLYDGDDDGYFSRLSLLVERRKSLAAIPVVAAGYERRGTGETYGQAWERMTAVERRELMLDAGVRATADMNASPRFTVTVPLEVTTDGEAGTDVNDAGRITVNPGDAEAVRHPR